MAQVKPRKELPKNMKKRFAFAKILPLLLAAFMIASCMTSLILPAHAADYTLHQCVGVDQWSEEDP